MLYLFGAVTVQEEKHDFYEGSIYEQRSRRRWEIGALRDKCILESKITS